MYKINTRIHNVCYGESFIFVIFFLMVTSSPWKSVGMLLFILIAIPVAWDQNNRSHIFPMLAYMLWGKLMFIQFPWTTTDPWGPSIAPFFSIHQRLVRN